MLVILLNIRILGAMKAANVFDSWFSVVQDDPHSYISSLYVGLSASAFASLGGGVMRFFLSLYGNLCGANSKRDWAYLLENILQSAVTFCLLGDIISCMRLSFDYWVYYEQGGDAYTVYRALTACMLMTHFGRYGIVEVLMQNISCLRSLHGRMPGADSWLMSPFLAMNLIVGNYVRGHVPAGYDDGGYLYGVAFGAFYYCSWLCVPIFIVFVIMKCACSKKYH